MADLLSLCENEMATKNKMTFTVEKMDQGNLTEFSARTDKLQEAVKDLKPFQMRWRRNFADTRDRFVGKFPVACARLRRQGNHAWH